MDPVEVTTVEDLVRQYAPELVPKDDWTERVVVHFPVISGSFLVSISLLQILGVYGTLPLTWIVIGSFALSSIGIGELIVRKHIANARKRFTRELAESPLQVYDIIVGKFTAEIEQQRANTLGANSKWGRARDPLAKAAQESARSVAYWTQRLAMDESNQVARQQLETAVKLKNKFDGALVELDARAQTLLSFFNECEARLAVLQSTKRDYEEARRLDVLTEQADSVVSEARMTLALIGQSFLQEATKVAQALGGVERLGILNLVGAVSADHVESLADRIHETSETERAALARLVEGVSR